MSTFKPLFPSAGPEYNQVNFAHTLEQLRLLAESIPNTPASTAWTTSNVTTTRTINADSTTLAEVADVLCTLINDLAVVGILSDKP